MSCKKCQNHGTIVLRKTDYYCSDCFLKNVNHKFRGCLGKNKVLLPNEKVLLCSSGGMSSTILLDLVHNGIMINHNKIRIVPFVLHVIDLENDKQLKNTSSIIEQCNRYNFKVYLMHLSEYMQPQSELGESNRIPQVNRDMHRQFHATVDSMSPTAINDFMMKIKRNLFIRCANILQCNYIFTAETTTTLAKNLLTNLTLGRGCQVHNDVSFSDSREDGIKILRPMKDISEEELIYYIKYYQLHFTDNNKIKENSLQSVIETFVTDLQENFPATVSTVCKTADKIDAYDENKNGDKCVICKSVLITSTASISALQATNFSSMVSFGKNLSGYSKNTLEDMNNGIRAQFPMNNENLCYGCSRNYSDVRKELLPPHIINALAK